MNYVGCCILYNSSFLLEKQKFGIMEDEWTQQVCFTNKAGSASKFMNSLERNTGLNVLWILV